ncbi:unnamed protein product [Enterobius vermicularis]|uniref:Uncharacterized protein n=1 Tax=Enterobius vermicularis TaxID=51028 RepID=A0A0N4VCJ7_ENTVE|nr:unnamed protein product [Enterobius vermicularis]
MINQKNMLLLPLLTNILLLLLPNYANAQHDAFRLPDIPQYAAKPTVPPEYKSFFELDGHARELVDTLIGPRPGGLVPEKSYEIARPISPTNINGGPSGGGISQLEKTLEQFFTGSGGESAQQFQLPPGFNQGFSLTNGGSSVASFSENSKPEHANVDENVNTTESSGSESSIKGIPNVFPDLAKPPIQLQQPSFFKAISKHMPKMPKFDEKPEVPEGGLGPAEFRRAPSLPGVPDAGSATEQMPDSSEYGALTDESSGSGGLIGSIINLIGLNAKKKMNTDVQSFGQTVGNIIGGRNSPIPAKNVISNVLYKALTSGSIQGNGTNWAESIANGTFNSSSFTLTDGQKAVIEENLEMIQNLITQPASPFCNPKPVPVKFFNIDAFMGKWYQVMNSPPFSMGSCSMVVYKKLADVNNGGVGTIFEIFEYTTDGTPYVKPRISSGYAILKQPGELIYRTTSYKEDVTVLIQTYICGNNAVAVDNDDCKGDDDGIFSRVVHVINVGPLNENGEYSFVILSTNCNYPLYVFARDPVVYKQSVHSNECCENR